MEYFSARVFYEELKALKFVKDKLPSLEERFINDRLFKGTEITDQESDVQNFVIDMIKHNSQVGSGDAEAQKNKALTKLVVLTEF